MDILPDDAPAPRLCHLIKWPDFDGYGFNLHAERSNPGQFIGKIDDESPAQMAGLREGDRIIEVNGVNIADENHRQVVDRIKSIASETKLLVLDPEADAWYKEQELIVKSNQINVVYIKTPVPRPQPDSPRAKFHHNHQHQSPSATSGASPAPAASDDANKSQSSGGTSSSSSSSSSKSANQQKSNEKENSSPKEKEEATTTTTETKQQLESQAPGSPTPISGSLETSDYNDDPINVAEHQKVAEPPFVESEKKKNQKPTEPQPSSKTNNSNKTRVSPPMSPDSGKGEDDDSNQPPPPKELTVEAEINRQLPPKSAVSDEIPPAAVIAAATSVESPSPIGQLQPDSLEEEQHSGEKMPQVSRSFQFTFFNSHCLS